MLIEAQYVHFPFPLPLSCGQQLPEFTLCYETYGQLNAERRNVVLVCHGLTANAHAAGKHALTDSKPGWWETAIGPGRMLDTERYFVIASDVVGGGGGSTGPASIDPRTGKPYGMRFPVVTIADMVEAQRHLMNHLGIDRLHTVIGGCMGGCQVMEWARLDPGRVERAVSIGATAKTSAHTIALWNIMRRAITSDPAWNGGDYYNGEPPAKGLAFSSIIGLLIWMGRDFLEEKFGRRLAARQDYSYSFEDDFEVEACLSRVESSVQMRLDANSLLYLMRAIDYFDLARGYDTLPQALAAAQADFLLVSYHSDWRYPPREVEELC
jgi:homoserine O-acetyltransferase